MSDNLALAINQIHKDFGEGAIRTLGSDARVDIDAISSGSLLVNEALGVGGFPRGRIVEIYGPESSGKTTLCLSAVAQAQRNGGLAAFIDVEHAIDPQYSRRLGVNIEDLLLAQPDSGEEALQILETLVRSGQIDIIIIDSVAALVTRQELQGEIGDATVGAQARLMSAALRKLVSIIDKAKTTVIFTNQIREKIGVMFGSPETTPGGRALKFYASIRIDIRRKEKTKDGDEIVGNMTKVKVVKNKVGPPFKEAEFEIIFNEGISKHAEVLDLALDNDIIIKRGSWFSYDGEQLAQGRKATVEHLKTDAKFYSEIENKVKAVINETSIF